MRLRVEPWFVLCAALFVAASGRASTPAPDSAPLAQQRSDIEAQTRRLEALFAAEQAACAERFAVNDCSEDVRRRRRETMAPLRARSLALDDLERQQRAQARLQAIESKRQTRRAGVPEAAPPPASAARPPLIASAPLLVVRRNPPVARQQALHDAAAQRAAAATQRRQEAEEGAERVRQRLQQRAQSGRQAAPLPVPN